MNKKYCRYRTKIPEPKALPGTNIKVPYVIVGDEAFPLKTYLLRPYPGKQLDNFDKKNLLEVTLTLQVSYNTMILLL